MIIGNHKKSATAIATMYYGVHINREKTILKTMEAVSKNGGNCLQLFVSNPRSSSLVSIDNYLKIADDIRKYSADYGFATIIHASYTINLARDFKNGKRTVPIHECPWIQLLLHELYISHLLGSVGVVLHVGKHTTQSSEQGLENMRIALEYIIDVLRQKELNAKIVLETPAGQGTELLTDLGDFLNFYNNQFSAEQRRYLGICVDTAHVWASGYELSDAYKMIAVKNANDVVAIHLNNSKVAKGGRVDRHATLFDSTGTIPQDDIRLFVELWKEKEKKQPQKPRASHHPLQRLLIILETPSANYADELAYFKPTVGK
jgi:deoxyribonuclease IV